jgi:N-methylhydantoinase A
MVLHGAMERIMARIGVDVGGTNTDLVLECEKGIFYHKVPSTLKDQSIGVVQGAADLPNRGYFAR